MNGCLDLLSLIYSSLEMSERQPLLKHQLPDGRQHVSPKIQIAILCAARMVESWVFFTISPFIAAMIEDLGVEQSRIGFYSGFVEAAFACTQCIFTFLLWTDLSDKYGRKPVLIISLAGLSVSAALFGFSSIIAQMIFFRSVAGIFSGSLTFEADLWLGEHVLTLFRQHDPRYDIGAVNTSNRGTIVLALCVHRCSSNSVGTYLGRFLGRSSEQAQAL